MRAAGQIYVEYATGPEPTTGGCRPSEVEHYDLGADPNQLDNIYPAARRSPEGELELELQRRMATLADCAGIAGRDSQPAAGSHCE